MNEKIKILLLFLISILLNISCSVKRNYESIESLAKNTIKYINQGNDKALKKLCISKDEYISEIHDYTDAADPKSGLPAEDFWRIFIVERRKAAIQAKIRKYKGKIISIDNIGDAENIFDYKKFLMYRKINLTLKIKDDNGNVLLINDNQILGSVIEETGSYRLLNIFR